MIILTTNELRILSTQTLIIMCIFNGVDRVMSISVSRLSKVPWYVFAILVANAQYVCLGTIGNSDLKDPKRILYKCFRFVKNLRIFFSPMRAYGIIVSAFSIHFDQLCRH
ncbi:hypothetical protein F5879DRAFT_938108 [Lentinula edodes]|nr:hypothetical protein F5879DRAFT_938108 [Lentinula edodes]